MIAAVFHFFEDYVLGHFVDRVIRAEEEGFDCEENVRERVNAELVNDISHGTSFLAFDYFWLIYCQVDDLGQPVQHSFHGKKMIFNKRFHDIFYC